MGAAMRARTRKSEPDYAAAVIAAYGVVPKPRHTAEHPWNAHKGGFPKPRGWRARSTWYVRGTHYTQSQERAGLQTFDGESVGADIAPEPKAEPVAEPVVVAPEPEPVAPAPVALACTCEADAPVMPQAIDAAAVAAYLRELAKKYGPRRAHKLSAMADFVTAAAGSR